MVRSEKGVGFAAVSRGKNAVGSLSFVFVIFDLHYRLICHPCSSQTDRDLVLCSFSSLTHRLDTRCMGDPGVDTNRQIKVVLTKLRIRHMRLTRGPMGNQSKARCKGWQESLSVAHVVGRCAAFPD